MEREREREREEPSWSKQTLSLETNIGLEIEGTCFLLNISIAYLSKLYLGRTRGYYQPTYEGYRVKGPEYIKIKTNVCFYGFYISLKQNKALQFVHF